jgi:hypothetical protein
MFGCSLSKRCMGVERWWWVDQFPKLCSWSFNSLSPFFRLRLDQYLPSFHSTAELEVWCSMRGMEVLNKFLPHVQLLTGQWDRQYSEELMARYGAAESNDYNEIKRNM